MQFVEANGAKIPAVGLGTWELRGRSCARLVEQALKLGYRHIDTAQAYENEREVGDGLRASRVRRDEVFVTTKVWTTHFAPNDLERSAKDSLTKLRLSEIDLLLLQTRTCPCRRRWARWRRSKNSVCAGTSASRTSPWL